MDADNFVSAKKKF